MQSNPAYLRMQTELTRDMYIAPIAAAFALFSTNFSSIDAALGLIYEGEQDAFGQLMMEHDFVGYLPDIEEFRVPVDSRAGDSAGRPLDSRLICYICQGSASAHRVKRVEQPLATRPNLK